jgi:heme/copper-type cytochrome/quinol oxidase subunit 3
MMWIFLLSDTFIFGCFLLLHDGADVDDDALAQRRGGLRADHRSAADIPLILIAIMTFVLISSSGTMALAVNYGYRRNRKVTAALMIATALLGATFVGMQAFEWTKLISEGVRPWSNPFGAPQFGASFFMITGFHGTHVTIGVIMPRRDRLAGAARRLRPRPDYYERSRSRALLALRRPRLGLHLRLLLPVVTRMADTTARTHTSSTPPPPRRRRPAASRSGLSRRLGLALRAQRLLLRGRRLSCRGDYPLDADPRLHAAEGRADRRGLHAHGGSGCRSPTRSSCRRSSCWCSSWF